MEYEFDLNCRVQRKRINPDGGTRVFSAVTKKFQQQFTGAVGDLRLLGEAGIGINERSDSHHAFQAVQISFNRQDG